MLKKIWPAVARFVGTPYQVDDIEGHNNKRERAVVQHLLRLNKKTGPLSGSVVFRFIKDSSQKEASFAWVDPHYHDPIAVRLSANGKAEWVFTDDPDEINGKWRTDFDKSSLAQDVLDVIKMGHSLPLKKSIRSQIKGLICQLS